MLLFWAPEFKFDNWCGLFGRGKKFPFPDSILASLHEKGMPTNNSSALHAAIGINDNFDLDAAGDTHATSQFRIRGRDLGFNLALALVGDAGLGRHERRGKERSSDSDEHYPIQ